MTLGQVLASVTRTRLPGLPRSPTLLLFSEAVALWEMKECDMFNIDSGVPETWFSDMAWRYRYDNRGVRMTFTPLLRISDASRYFPSVTICNICNRASIGRP
jgi:hypothetical protein